MLSRDSTRLVARRNWLILAVVALLMTSFYMTYNTYGNWDFALPLRSTRVLAILLVSVGISVATITFQTIVENNLLTPNIMGMDEAFIFLQTVLITFNYKFRGIAYTEFSQGEFLLNVLLMVGFSYVLFGFFIRKQQSNIFLMLMAGMTFGLVLRSMSQFFQVLLDPNEYQLLLTRVFPSFGNIGIDQLPLGAVLIALSVGLLWFLAPRLDVYRLGRSTAISLGVPVAPLQRWSFFAISLLISVSTALVGPLTFLGFIVANIAYRVSPLVTHRYLYVFTSLLAFVLLMAGQTGIEHLVGWNTPIAVIVELAGGAYFLYVLFTERKVT